MGATGFARTAKKHAVRAIRTRIGPVGELPDFLLIGVPRGGTTACFRQLARHPQVGPPLQKEVRFFDHYWQEGERFYRRWFPTARQMAANGWRITGEATPRYLQHPDAPGRAADMLPDARFIVLLRDPVMRAWSHYRLLAERGEDPRTFEDAIRDEIDHPFGPRMSRGRDYLGAGEYAPAFRRWFERFPRERFLVILSEDYYSDNAAAQARIQAHLGLDPFIPPVVRMNSSGAGGVGMDPATAERLREHFAPMLSETSALLSIELPW